MTNAIQPPTACLPPIARIATYTITQLFDSVQYLHELYRPQVRGSCRRRREQGLRLAASPNHDDDDRLQLVRPDAFERAYAIRWLTALIAQLKAQQEIQDRTHIDTTQTSASDTLPIDADTLIQHAASLIATCAGVAAAGKIQREFTFDSPLAGQIHVALTDIPLDNHDYGSVGAQTWGGACVLAEMIAEHPDRFGLGSTGTRPLRVLELGAGTGLVGLTVAKLLQTLPLPRSTESDPDSALHRPATIVLTDFYPAVLDNLQSNIDTNFPTADDTDHAIVVNSHPLDWSSFSTTESIPDVLSTPFDVIFGADVVYEAQHAVWIHDCLKSLLLYPDDSNEDALFHLLIPLRPAHTFESSTVEEVFGSKDRVLEGSRRELTILSKESIVCEAYGDEESERNGTDDDVEYLYYRIGWTR